MNNFKQEEMQTEEGISLQQLFNIIWDNILLIIFVTLWVVVFGIVYTFIIVKPKYTAVSQVMLQVDTAEASITEQSAISIANALLLTFQDFILSDLVLESVIEEIPEIADMKSSELKKMISITSKTGNLSFGVKIEHPSQELANIIVNKIVENTIKLANDPDNGFVFLQNKLKVVSPAKVPTSPSSPNKVLNIAVSLVLGAVLSLAIVFIKEFFNNKYQSKDELEKHLNLRVIAIVPGTIKERKLAD